jgi:hypothetical protein
MNTILKVGMKFKGRNAKVNLPIHSSMSKWFGGCRQKKFEPEDEKIFRLNWFLFLSPLSLLPRGNDAKIAVLDLGNDLFKGQPHFYLFVFVCIDNKK